MAIANGYLYVANSDGMNYTNGYANGTTVSKVNLSTFSEEKRITVSLNPCKVCADSKGNIFVISMGNYYDIPATLEKINSADEVTTLSTPATIMAISGLYALHYQRSLWLIRNQLCSDQHRERRCHQQPIPQR